MNHALSVLLLIGNLAQATVNTTPQPDVNLTRYCGRWYEQARYENWFEQDLDQVYTDYTPLASGSIQILNHGTDPQGRKHKTRGKAVVTSPGQLGVSFVWPYWWFRTPYKILYVSPDYEGALVSGEGSDYLWILTREEDASPLLIKKLKQEAQLRGFDTTKLRRTTHQKRKSTVPATNKPGL